MMTLHPRFALALLVSLVCGLAPPLKLFALEVAFEADHRLPLCQLRVVIAKNGVSDPVGKFGKVNLMGQLLLRGTQGYSKKELTVALEQIGATLEVSTGLEAIAFHGTVISSHLADYLALLKKVMTQPTFPVSELEKLKNEAISEIKEQQGNDGWLAAQKFNEVLFAHHPYGQPTLGKIPDLKTLTRQDMLESYRQLLHPEGLYVLGVGDADPAVIEAWSQTLNLPLAEARQAVSLPPAPEAPKKQQVVFVDKPERSQTQINIGQIGPLMSDPNYFPLYLGNHVFGGGSFAAILMNEIRVKRGWSYGASSHFSFAKQPRSWQAHLFPAAKNTTAALLMTLKLIGELKTHGISESQFLFAQKSLVNKSAFLTNTPKKRIANLFLEKTLNLKPGMVSQTAEQLSRLTLEQVNQALKDFLKPEALTVVILGTAKPLLQSVSQALAVPVEQIRVIPYTE